MYVFLWQRPHKAMQEELTKFHSDDYIKFLRSIRPDNMSEFNKQMQRCTYVLIVLHVYCFVYLFSCFVFLFRATRSSWNCLYVVKYLGPSTCVVIQYYLSNYLSYLILVARCQLL